MDPAGVDVLVLGAFEPEVAPLRAALGGELAGRVGERSVAARVIGIGLPVAASCAAFALADTQPKMVAIVGTCGAYRGGGLAIGDVAVARTVRLVDPSAVAGLSQFPAPMATSLDADARAGEALAACGARLADVATTLAITVDDDAASRIALGTGAHVEHLEAYGVAAACAARAIPFVAALGVANVVGAAARGQWKLHHRDAAEAAVACVVRWLNAGAGSAVAYAEPRP